MLGQPVVRFRRPDFHSRPEDEVADFLARKSVVMVTSVLPPSSVKVTVFTAGSPLLKGSTS